MNYHRQKLFGCGFGAACLAVLALAVFMNRSILATRYYMWQLDKARSWSEARELLAKLSVTTRADSACRAVLVNGLCEDMPWLSLWAFVCIDDGAILVESWIPNFSHALEKDEKLLSLYSHYLRWRLGKRLWLYRETIAPQRDELRCLFWVCGGVSPDEQPADSSKLISWYEATSLPDLQLMQESQNGIRTRALAWFLGMIPIPKAGPTCAKELSDWLRLRDTSHSILVYDKKLERYRDRKESDSLWANDGTDWLDLAIPKVPIPKWDAKVPKMPVTRNDIPW